MPAALRPARVGPARIADWLRAGMRGFRQAPGASAAFAGLFVAAGAVAFYMLIRTGRTPMIFALAGGFMLVGPLLTVGYMHAADLLRAGRAPRLADFFAGFRTGSAALWAIAFVAMFLFLIWLTDAAVLYALYFGRAPILPSLASLAGQGASLGGFLLFGSAMGAALAFGLYAVSAFSVPLLFHRRAPLPAAVGASVRAVFANLPALLLWGLVLAGAMFAAMLLFLPLVAVVFPVLAFASDAAYRDVFPLDGDS